MPKPTVSGREGGLCGLPELGAEDYKKVTVSGTEACMRKVPGQVQSKAYPRPTVLENAALSSRCLLFLDIAG